MRKRIENRVRKAIRIASQAEPSFALRCSRLERRGRTLQEALIAITADRQVPANERGMGAELLTLAGRPQPYRPLIEHFLDCDGTTAWSLIYAFRDSSLKLSPEDKAKLARILQEDPEEERRAATAQFLGRVRAADGTRMLLGVLENQAESGYVRGRAAEALRNIGKPAAVEACVRCLKDPDPVARFWAVFALGGMARYRKTLHPVAIAALQSILNDTGEMPGYWSVGREARAMLELMIPEQQELGEKERDRILADANAPADLRRWAECYSHKVTSDNRSCAYIQASYKNLRWIRFRGGQ